MKIFRCIYLFILPTVLAVAFTACNGNNNQKVSDTYKNPDNVAGRVPPTGNERTTEMGVDSMLKGEDMVFKDSIAPAFKQKFNQLVDAYLKMKDGFVKDDEKQIDQQATQMLSILNNMPDSLLSGGALAYCKEKKSFLQQHLTLYKESEKDKNKRLNFVFLSTVMVKSVKALGYDKQQLYVDYCPMANNSKGAYWLSQIREIQNPYLGQKMPNCGEVKKEL
jgi:membrane fusion protein, copper/silver efflux system